VAFVAGVKLLAEEINNESTLAKQTCYVYAGTICNRAFPNQPDTIHEDIFDELLMMLQLYFEALQYIVSLNSLALNYAKINIYWPAKKQLVA